jgi:hypothetical protein
VSSPDLPGLLDAVVIQAGSTTAALAARDVERFVLIRDLLPVPLAPPGVEGLAVVDGAPALVIDVAARLAPAQPERRDAARPPAPPRPARVAIVCRVAGETVALVGAQVRSACRLRTVARPGAASAEWRGAAIPLLDLGALVAAAVATPERPGSDDPSWARAQEQP